MKNAPILSYASCAALTGIMLSFGLVALAQPAIAGDTLGQCSPDVFMKGLDLDRDVVELSHPTCVWADQTELPWLADTINDYSAATSESQTPADTAKELDRVRASRANDFCQALGYDRAGGWAVSRMSDNDGSSEAARGQAVTVDCDSAGSGFACTPSVVRPRLHNSYYGSSVGPHVFARIRCERD